ncbi:MAG: 4-alpha-glucanotransferase [Candidatus Methylacidiphilales bacterium]
MNPRSDRAAGVFFPLFALRSDDDQGIGDTRALHEAVDWCVDSGFKVLQILPVNETSGDNSPYNAISALALEPTTLSIRPGELPGMDDALHVEVCSRHGFPSAGDDSVDYRRVRAFVRDASFNAMDRLSDSEEHAFESFRQAEAHWLNDYVLFRTLMEWNGQSPVWQSWPQDHRSTPQAREWQQSLVGDERTAWLRMARYYAYLQWALYGQWDAVHHHARQAGVALMGDIPFGVSRHSADVWANPEWFDLEWSGGAPPEPFFQGDDFIRKWGQNWGIPCYRWDRMKESGYLWWRSRVAQVARHFDIFRIDHVLGFYRLYSFPWTPDRNGEFVDHEPDTVREIIGDVPRFLPHADDSPEGMKANQQQGEELLRMILDAAGGAVVVGEDLGVVPDYVRPSLTSLGISGFKIPVFERIEATQEYKPSERYPVLSVLTLATHDHAPMKSLWEEWWRDYEEGRQAPDESECARRGTEQSWEIYRTQRFLGLPDQTLYRHYEPVIRERWIEKGLKAPCWLSIFMITDLFGWETRFNVPGPVADSNWSQRLPQTLASLQRDTPYHGMTEWMREKIQSAGR